MAIQGRNLLCLGRCFTQKGKTVFDLNCHLGPSQSFKPLRWCTGVILTRWFFTLFDVIKVWIGIFHLNNFVHLFPFPSPTHKTSDLLYPPVASAVNNCFPLPGETSAWTKKVPAFYSHDRWLPSETWLNTLLAPTGSLILRVESSQNYALMTLCICF